MLNELSKSIRFDNASKGFDPTEGGINRYLLLTVSEICEAQNELRDGHEPTEIYYSDENIFNDGAKKPEGFPVELADAAIRILDIGGKFNIDFNRQVDVPDYGDRPIDDWLLGICERLALAGNYDPAENTEDFSDYLCEALNCIFALSELYGIPIMAVINQKLQFNRTRPPKHGRKF